MKLLCVGCDAVMAYAERQLPGDGTMAVVYACPACGRETALLTNPMETRLVSGLGIEVGGRAVPPEPLELVRGALDGGAAGGAAAGGGAADGAALDPAAVAATAVDPGAEAAPTALRPGAVAWSAEARARLEVVPSFVRGMVKRIYAEWAAERGIAEMTPAIMDRARRELGLEGM